MNDTTGGVVVVGAINVDTVVQVKAHALPGETVLGTSLELRPGGKGANQAIAARRAGAPVRIIGQVGADRRGVRYTEALQRTGINIDKLGTSAEATTGDAFITVSADGENSIVVIPGANSLLSPDDCRLDQLTDTRVLLTQLESPVAAVAAALLSARQQRILTVLNASPIVAGTAELLELADIVIVNEHENVLLGNPPDACVTLGADGARWGALSIRPPAVTVLDTTGAGDVFAGTLAARLALGDDRENALQRAVEESAKATTYRGAQEVNFFQSHS